MALQRYEIQSYAVSLISEESGQGRRPAAIIHARTHHSAALRCQVYLRYYLDGVARPANQVVDNEDGSKLFMIGFPYAQLAASVDLLRHEAPMFFVFNPGRNSGHLATSDEPVGEGDVDADFER